MAPIIEVSNLSKEYRIGHQHHHDETLPRGDFRAKMKAPFRLCAVRTKRPMQTASIAFGR